MRCSKAWRIIFLLCAVSLLSSLAVLSTSPAPDPMPTYLLSDGEELRKETSRPGRDLVRLDGKGEPSSRRSCKSAGAAPDGPAAPSAGSLALSPPEKNSVALVHARRKPTCPKKFIFVNTHTYGRHHNQLQEFMNIIIWGERMGRTAVLGYFRADHRWVDPSELYDFSGIRDRYCVITAKELADALPLGRTVAACFGQGVAGTPLKRIGGGKAIKCSMQPHVPAHYNTRRATNTTAEFLPRILRAQEDMLVLSGQIAFFLRPGLADFSAIFGLLKPAAEIADEVAAFVRRSPFMASGGVFSIHLRQRERDCLKEVGEAREDGAAWLTGMSRDDWTIVETQCAITTKHVVALLHRLGLCLDREQPMFLASDHENRLLEQALVAHGAVMYEGGKFHTREHGGLKGLAVDFFLLVQGAYFTGNQLSSISQNVCFMRLGQGLSCDGFLEPLARYLVRDISQVVVS